MNSSQGSDRFTTLEDRARAYDLGVILLQKIMERQGIQQVEQTEE